VLRVIDEERLQQNAKTVGAALRGVLERLHQKHEIVGEVRGRGLMLAIELVTDRKSKRPAAKEAAEIFERTREHGFGRDDPGRDAADGPPVGETEPRRPRFAVNGEDGQVALAR